MKKTISRGTTLRRVVSIALMIVMFASAVPAFAEETPSLIVDAKDAKIEALNRRVSELETQTTQLRTENARLRATVAVQAKRIRIWRNHYILAVRRIRKLVKQIAGMFGPWHASRASWYGPGFYGRGMAGGGVLRPNMRIFAHKTMRFGTKVQFKYGRRTVVAVARDRGPYIAGREFDLGPGTARALGFDGVGTVKWRIVRR